MKKDFEIGDRVQLSEAGRRGAKRYDRRGIVLRKSKSSSSRFWVQWETLKTPQLFHRTFLEPEDEGSNYSAGARQDEHGESRE